MSRNQSSKPSMSWRDEANPAWKASIPAQIRCATRGEWKNRDDYSLKSLDEYNTRARHNKATPNDSGITCKEHSATQQKLRCEGPCNSVRAIEFFSKSSRRRGRNWCVHCTDYQNCLEIGQVLPPPNSQLSADEMMQRLPYAGNLRDEAATAAIVGDIRAMDVPSTTSASSGTVRNLPVPRINLGRGSTMGHGSTVGAGSVSNRGNVSQAQSTVGFRTVFSELMDIEDDNFYYDEPAIHRTAPSAAPTRPAPHWVPQQAGPNNAPTQMAESVPGSVANVTGNSNSMIWDSTESNAASVHPRHRILEEDRNPVTFNAWGPDGDYQRMTKAPTVASTSTYDSVLEGQEKVGKNGWVKPAGRRIMPQMPAYLRFDLGEKTDDYDDYDAYDGESDDTI
ncbi:hypothetical protein B0T26DRAFT_755895 [Lasiosphaeria miniovina]|uniref:Stc1 domain-containing protein n=1 Tax=Lasiosphaeria miniovina TaxID=1954250 RepID=A0AA39ZZ92_9PEZI|nr:uncharacterized protein B0T26DRAFT_755895 [Lasiosphaeria miniovina]KAK0706393.1 hypothetical protein B0T26DRAFT_755895 [Lasiosphaeria miniovina]